MSLNKRVHPTNITVVTDQIKRRKREKKTKRKAIEKGLIEEYLN
jgi:hypothetical protein